MDETRLKERLTDCALLIGLTPEQIDVVRGKSQIIECGDLEPIITVDTPGDAIYIILEGRVLIEGNQGVTIASLSAESTLHEQYEGDFFGEMAIVDHEYRSATVYSVGETRLLRIPKERLFEAFTLDTDMQVVILMNIARILSHRLRRTNQKFARPRRPPLKS